MKCDFFFPWIYSFLQYYQRNISQQSQICFSLLAHLNCLWGTLTYFLRLYNCLSLQHACFASFPFIIRLSILLSTTLAFAISLNSTTVIEIHNLYPALCHNLNKKAVGWYKNIDVLQCKTVVRGRGTQFSCSNMAMFSTS